MAKLVTKPAVIKTDGTPVEEIIGRLNTKTDELSIARMFSRKGWSESGQVRKFAEYILVLKGALHLKLRTKALVVRAGEAVIVKAGEWVQHSTPDPGGAHYLAVCVPAYSPRLVRRV
jgi:mannose-6-phosphate isomerase-like protein (cupin superfamily)